PYYNFNSYGSYYPYYGAPLNGGFGGYGGSGIPSYGGPLTYNYYPFSGAGYYPYPAGAGFGTAYPWSGGLPGGGAYVGSGVPIGMGFPGTGYGVGAYPNSLSTVGYGGFAC